MESPQFWLGLALGCAGMFVALLGVFVLSLVRPGRAALSPEARAEMAQLPLTPLQRRAWWGLLIGVVMTLALAVVFIARGPTNWSQDTGMRLVVYTLFIGGLAANPVLLRQRRKRGQKGLIMDERDRLVLSRAPLVQSLVVPVSLAVWAMALTEVYQADGGIPIVYPTLIFGSTLIVNMIALYAGILLGYRSMESHGEG